MLATLIAITILAFSAPQGWQATIVGHVDTDKVSQIVEMADTSPCGLGSAQHMRIIDDDPQGFWLSVDVTGLEGKTFEVWRQTYAVIRFSNGKQLKSSRIIAVADPCGFTVLDNAVRPFLVTERLHGYGGSVRLYVRFAERVEIEDVVRWRIGGYR